MKDGMKAENQRQDWVKFIRRPGEFDIHGLAEARAGVEGIRNILTSGGIQGSWRDQIESSLRAQEERNLAVWVRETSEESEKKRAIAAAASLRTSRLTLMVAGVLFLSALGAVVWELVYLRLH